jgi:hypothetical protein
MTSKRFLFVTPLTPPAMLDSTRLELHQCYLAALERQSYPFWTAILIGEEEKTEGKKIYIKSAGVSKTEKLVTAYTYISAMQDKPDYIIRLDDDDLISEAVLKTASEKEFDCFADKYHSFYDAVSGMISQQKRPWLANTVIHKLEHALQLTGEEYLPLFTQDHSKAWHIYYNKMKIKWARKSHPVYLRILSPTSITANRISGNAEERDSYQKYLQGFGKWKLRKLKDFKLDNLPKR